MRAHQQLARSSLPLWTFTTQWCLVLYGKGFGWRMASSFQCNIWQSWHFSGHVCPFLRVSAGALCALSAYPSMVFIVLLSAWSDMHDQLALHWPHLTSFDHTTFSGVFSRSLLIQTSLQLRFIATPVWYRVQNCFETFQPMLPTWMYYPPASAWVAIPWQ